jgi:CheY-like chemotaxis protein
MVALLALEQAMTTVLVVDDSPVDRRLARGLLEAESQWTVQEAEHGLAALAIMNQTTPDVVVTDLQMPEMDGLMLLTEVGARYPTVPVILMTAYGSESLAIQALKSGAAGYVPKSELAAMLPRAVREVLNVKRGNRLQERLMESITASRIHFSLESDPVLIDAVVDLVQRILKRVGICGPNEQMRVAVALGHALQNALYHGSLELTKEQIEETREALLQGNKTNVIEERLRQPPYCGRAISLDVSITPMEARFVVNDQGPGFDVRAVLRKDRAEIVLWSEGRGLLLMRSIMDEVIYNDRGNEVTLIKAADWC